MTSPNAISNPANKIAAALLPALISLEKLILNKSKEQRQISVLKNIPKME